jgi:hypothetical protein
MHSLFNERKNSNALYRFTQIEAKNTQYAASLPVRNFYSDRVFSQEAKDKLWNSFVQEFHRVNGKYGDHFLNKEYIMFSFLKDNSIVKSLTEDKLNENKEYILKTITDAIQLNIDHDEKNLLTEDKGYLKNIDLTIRKSYTNLNSYVGNFILNNFIWNNAYLQLVNGDLANTKSWEDYVKRNSGLIASGLDHGEDTHSTVYYNDNIENGVN